MKTKNNTLAILSIGIVLVIGLFGIGMVMAHQTEKGNNENTMMNQELHEGVEKAFENNDYTAWRTAVQDMSGHEKILATVNQENFQEFKAFHEAMEDMHKSSMMKGMHNGGESDMPCMN